MVFVAGQLRGRLAGTSEPRNSGRARAQNDFMAKLRAFVIQLVANFSHTSATFKSALLRYNSPVAYMWAYRWNYC